MPEGHTIHRMARDHAKWLGNQSVTMSSPQGRFDEGAARLNGWVFRRAFAHGKHLFYVFEGNQAQPVLVHIHLGLFGRFRKRKAAEDVPSPNCRLRMQTDTAILDLSGPTCCEVMTQEQADAKCAQLGPDPLRDDGDVDLFVQRLSRRRIPIAAALLDQKVIAGLGNIYRADLLYAYRIDPLTPARDLNRETVEALWNTSVWWLELGVRANRIITVLPESPKRLPRLKRREALLIYGKSHCPECGDQVQKSQVGNRTLYACQRCQVRTQ